MKKILGLVLELNPPHNGHQYFIDEAKRLVKPDVTIGILSTNFTMRGDISVIDKFTKTKLALELGLDIVLELPAPMAINSADYFCYYSIKTLVDFGISDLAFGAELANLEKLKLIKNAINSEYYHEMIKKYLDKGLSYSASSYKVIQDLFEDDEIKDNFTLPNNTLGVQYLNSLDKLNANINVTLIKRIENNYFDEEITSKISSATAIRNKIIKSEDVSLYHPKFKTQYNFIDLNLAYNNIFQLIKFQLITKDNNDLQKILTVSEGIENRLINMISISRNYNEFLKNVQTRRYTLNKVKRLLIHILLNTSKYYNENNYSYIRLLGLNEVGRRYLRLLNKDIKNKIITSFKNTDDYNALMELKATKIYGLITNNDNLYLEEYKIPIKQGEI